MVLTSKHCLTPAAVISSQFHKFVVGKGSANIRRTKDETDTRALFKPNQATMMIFDSGNKETAEIFQLRHMKQLCGILDSCWRSRQLYLSTSRTADPADSAVGRIQQELSPTKL